MKTASARDAASQNSHSRTSRSHLALLAAITTALFLFSAVNVRAESPDFKLPKAQSEMTAVDWAAYSHRLVDGMRSDSDGIVQAALRLSIQYATLVDVDDAVVDMMKVYRNHSDERVRHLAAVALASTGSELALGYLRLSLDYEKSPAIQRTIRAVTSAAG